MSFFHRIGGSLAIAATCVALGGYFTASEALTINVPADQPTIQAAINAAAVNDIVLVAPGTYVENLQLNKTITLRGAQWGVSACGRIATETIVTAANPTVEALQIIGPGATDAIIDGFTFRGTTTAFACVQSIGSTTNGMQFLNNRVREFVGVGVYLNKSDVNGIVSGNEIDGSGQVGAGALIQLDGVDAFHGLQFTNNCLQNSLNTGLFVDGNHIWTAGSGATLPPAITGNLIKNCGTGANLGSRSFNTTALPTATIANNTFLNNTFDGLQGGPQNTSISGNTFQGNGRSGLALTSFGNAGVDRGARNCTITGNTFSGNVSEALFLSTSQQVGSISTNVINNNDFLGATMGVRYGNPVPGTETINVTNWWNDLGGPNYPPLNPNAAGAGLFGTNMQFQSWLNGPIAGSPLCNQVLADKVTPAPPPTCLDLTNTCVTVPMNIARVSSTNARAYSVTFTLSSNLALCVSPGSSITQGTYLSSVPAIDGTQFQVIDNGGGSYTVDCAILGTTCGATAATGNLFNLSVKKAPLALDGTATVTVTEVLMRDCLNAPIAAAPGSPMSFTIDTAAPTAIANLAAAQLKTGNDADGTTKINLTFTPSGDPTETVKIYRAGFGSYPEYDDAGGVVPATPAYPPGGPWSLVVSQAANLSGYTDEPTTRDFWYYVAFTVDGCGNVSAVSNKTGGTLNYHLGDVVPATTGNNLVNTADISVLGAAYGQIDGGPFYLNYLDVGPTTDFSVNARPTTDNRLQFEDLIMFAINFGIVSKPTDGRVVEAATADAVRLDVPALPEPGNTFVASVNLSSAGRIQGVSLNLDYDRTVVEPVAVEAGELMGRQGSEGLVLSSAPGNVDAAVLGTGATISGSGELARVTFRVLGRGDARVALGSADARDSRNEKVSLNVAGGVTGGVKPVVATFLGANYPNPFHGSTSIPLGLKTAGLTKLAVFDVAGRLVKTLIDGPMEAGSRVVEWDGRDDGGRSVASGFYVIRLTAPDDVRTRSVKIVR